MPPQPPSTADTTTTYTLPPALKLTLTIALPLTFTAIFIGMFFHLRRMHQRALAQFEVAPGVGVYIPARTRRREKTRRGRSVEGGRQGSEESKSEKGAVRCGWGRGNTNTDASQADTVRRPEPVLDGIAALRDSHEMWMRTQSMRLQLSAFRIEQQRRQRRREGGARDVAG